jgi:hypothetical protein
MQPLFKKHTTITRDEDINSQASGAPVLSRRVVGCYSGLQTNKQEIEARPLDADLAVNIITYMRTDTYVDPSELGGAECLLSVTPTTGHDGVGVTHETVDLVSHCGKAARVTFDYTFVHLAPARHVGT